MTNFPPGPGLSSHNKENVMRQLSRPAIRIVAAAALAGLAGCVGAPAPGPVAYTPGYAPNPVYGQPGYSAGTGYAPQSAPVQQVAYGVSCFAGVYTCQLPQQLPVGTQCSCPGLGAPSFGNVR